MITCVCETILLRNETSQILAVSQKEQNRKLDMIFTHGNAK